MRQISRLSLRDLLYIAFRDKNRILAIVLVSLLGAAAYIAFIADTVYVAESRVLVRVGREKLAGVETINRDNYNILFQERGQDIHNGLEILRDPQFSYALLDRLKVGFQPPEPPQGFFKRTKFEIKRVIGTVKDWLLAPLYWVGLRTAISPEEQMLQVLRASLAVEAIEDTDVIKLSFAWTDPEFAAKAVNAVVDEFLAKQVQVYESPDSERFYVDQLADQDKRLRLADASLDQFRADQGITNITLQKEMLLREITESEARLSDVTLRLAELGAVQSAVTANSALGGDWPQTPEVRGRPLIDLTPIDRQFYELAARRALLSTTHTADAPDMQQLAQRIASLRREKLDSLTAHLRSTMAIDKREHEALTALLADKRARLAHLNQAGAVNNELERARNTAEQNYLSYKKKAEELRVSDQLNDRKISGLRVVSFARPPALPVAPRKWLILGLAAAIGLFFGLSYSAIAEYFNHTFRSADDVEQILGVRLLMTVPMARPRSCSG